MSSNINHNNNHDPYINRVIFSKYLVLKKIGKGSFGVVYSGIITLNQEKIAIKMEKIEKNSPGILEIETRRLLYLQGEGIPKIFCYGNNQTHNILIQELLGRSLEDIFNSCNKKFSLKTVCVLGIEMLKLIKYVHSKHHIHRDIKPDNFMTGREENENKIYIIDFGLAKKYFSTSKNSHIKFCTGKSLTGTARYCARNAHRGYEQSRRDDIESIGYVLMYFLLGSLPWQGLKIKQGEEQFQKIAEKKYNTPFEELCKGQPNEFLMYFKHVDSLEFEEEPNYDFLIGLFQEMINKYCVNCYYDFDWKKNTMKHLNESQQINGKDVSLLVNKNNGQSTLNESKNGTKLEVNNDDFEGENIKKDNFYIKEHLNFEETNNNSEFNYTNINNFNNSNDNNNFNNNNNLETERKKKMKSIGRSSSDISKEIKKKNSYKKNNIPKLKEKNNSGNNNVNHLSNSHNFIHKKSNKLKYSKKNLTVINKDNDYLYDTNNTNNYKHNNIENNNREYNINKKLDFNDINIEITNNKDNSNKDNIKDNNKDNSNNKRKKHRKHKSMENANDYNDDDIKCQCKIF